MLILLLKSQFMDIFISKLTTFHDNKFALESTFLFPSLSYRSHFVFLFFHSKNNKIINTSCNCLINAQQSFSSNVFLFSFASTNSAGINGGYYSGALQQAHSTTPHEAPHSAGAHAPQSVPPPQTVQPPPVSVVAAAPPPGIPHGLVSKSVS